METEIWKDVVGYEGMYQVSNLGRVKGLERIVRHPRGGGKVLPEKIKNPGKHNQGYFAYGLSNLHSSKRMLGHRLVAMAFIPNPENKPHVAHWDGCKTNNRVDNLRWATATENASDKNRHGKHNKGRRNGGSKITASDVRKIRSLSETSSNRALCKMFCLSETQIHRIINRKRWKHI